MTTLLLFYLLTINAVGFLIMLTDKEKAKRHLWRIPESTLLTCALLGGSLGSYLGMRVFHHKTRKPKFYIGIPLIFTFQLAAGIFLWIYLQ